LQDRKPFAALPDTSKELLDKVDKTLDGLKAEDVEKEFLKASLHNSHFSRF
jgi:hypothetical protein